MGSTPAPATSSFFDSSNCLFSLKGYVEVQYDTSQNMISASITVAGVEYVRNNFEISSISRIVIGDQIIGGDKITASTSGNHSPVVIQSKNVNILNQTIEKLEYEIEHNYKGSDKDELIRQVQEIRQLSGNKKNYPKITSILGNLLSKTNNIASIVSAVFQLLEYFKA